MNEHGELTTLINALFTNGIGEKAERLVLVDRAGRNLGGWSRAAIVQQLRTHLAALLAQEGGTK